MHEMGPERCVFVAVVTLDTGRQRGCDWPSCHFHTDKSKVPFGSQPGTPSHRWCRTYCSYQLNNQAMEAVDRLKDLDYHFMAGHREIEHVKKRM